MQHRFSYGIVWSMIAWYVYGLMLLPTSCTDDRKLVPWTLGLVSGTQVDHAFARFKSHWKCVGQITLNSLQLHSSNKSVINSLRLCLVPPNDSSNENTPYDMLWNCYSKREAIRYWVVEKCWYSTLYIYQHIDSSFYFTFN